MENQPTKTSITKIVLLGIVLGVGGLVLLWLTGHPEEQPTQTLQIGSALYSQVEVSDSPEERAQGLSHRETLCQECAMVFVFDQPGQYGFWMKDMRFRIDILWVRDGRVVHKESDVAPDNQTVMKPEVWADQVVETLPDPATKVGDSVRIIY